MKEDNCYGLPSLWEFIGKFKDQSEMFSRYKEAVWEHTKICAHPQCKELRQSYGKMGDDYWTEDLIQYTAMHPAYAGAASNIEAAIINEEQWLKVQKRFVGELGLEEYLKRLVLILKQDFQLKPDITLHGYKLKKSEDGNSE